MNQNKSTCPTGDLEEVSISLNHEHYQEYHLCEIQFGYPYIAEVLGTPLNNSGHADLAKGQQVNSDENVRAGTLQQLGVGNSTVEVQGNGSHSVLHIMPSSHTIVPSSMDDETLPEDNKDAGTLQDDKENDGTLLEGNLNAGTLLDNNKDVASMALEGNPSYKTVQNRPSRDINYYFCSICGNGYNTTGALKVHMRACSRKENRQSIEERRCELCGKLLSSVNSLRNHMRSHLNPETFRCSRCMRKFFEESLYTAHMAWHKRQDELHAESQALTTQNGGKALVVKEYKCSFCLQNFTAIFDVGQVKRRYACDTCRIKYNKLPDRRQRKQQPTCYYRCDQCGREYVSPGFLHRHNATCNGVFKAPRNQRKDQANSSNLKRGA